MRRLLLAILLCAWSVAAEAAISCTNLTSGLASCATTCNTASISPGTNKLDLVTIVQTSGGAGTPTLSGAGGTWVQVVQATDSGGLKHVTTFRDLSGSPGSGALTITVSGTQNAYWSVDECSGTDTSGTHGSGAIVQTVTSNLGSLTNTGNSVTLAALGSANNAAFGSIRTSTVATVTKGASFTELMQQNNVGGPTIETEWAINQTVVGWTWASQTTFEVMTGIEIKAAAGAAQSNQPLTLTGVGN